MLEQIKTYIYLDGTRVMIFTGIVAVLALLVLYRLLYRVEGERLSNRRAAFAGGIFAALLVLPLPILLLFRPGVSASEAVGEMRYRDECVVCHGLQGNRLPGVSLGSQEYLQRLGDAGMEKVISEGKGVMPAWGRDHEGPLSDQDIRMIIAYLKANARTGEPSAAGAGTPATSPAAGGTPSADAGRQIFSSNCVPCHGANGSRIPAANLSSKSFLDGVDNASLIAIITTGKGSMPGFGASSGGTLSDSDVQSVAEFLRTLAQAP